MKIKFINHSSFIIDHNEIKLICDPWLEGTAFDNGWSLLSETQMRYEEFREITHIWFSHEHPDHFSPPNLLKIPKEYRENITVLFQETTDRKVAEFCKKIGFKDQIELKENLFYSLSDTFEILCNPYTDGDSYAYFKVGDCKILNLNDCIVSTEKRAIELNEKLGEVDLLFTQFGYANKVGNIEDVKLRESASKEKLERIRHQNKFLKPKKIIPFASFIYFCNEENTYMNNGINKIDKVHAFIENELKTKCMVMYPNDTWELGDEWDSKKSIRNYLDDYTTISILDSSISNVIEIKSLQAKSSDYIEILKCGYQRERETINKLTASIYLTDYKKSFTLSGLEGLIESDINYDLCDIALSSEALLYCFEQLWGGDTLNVNARFQIPKKGRYDKFRNFGTIASSLNRKEDFPFETHPSIPTRIRRKIKHLLTKAKQLKC
jgi:hypothetical protein